MKENLVLAFAGPIGVGKTTGTKLVSSRLGYAGFFEPVVDNEFLPPYYKDMSRWSFTLQIKFLVERVNHYKTIKKVKGGVIQDRTLYEDPINFATYLQQIGHMTDNELSLYLNVFQHYNQGLRQPDIIINLTSTFETGYKRIISRGREDEIQTPKEFFKGIHNTYNNFAQICESKYGIPVYTIDTEKINLNGPREISRD